LCPCLSHVWPALGSRITERGSAPRYLKRHRRRNQSGQSTCALRNGSLVERPKLNTSLGERIVGGFSRYSEIRPTEDSRKESFVRQSSRVGRVFSTSEARGRLRTGSSLRILPSRNTSTRLANSAMSCS